jgi:hypothetical protein
VTAVRTRRRHRPKTPWERFLYRLERSGRFGQVGFGVTIVIGALLLLVAVRLTSARSHLSRAKSDLVASRTAVTGKQIDQARTLLDQADRALRGARHDTTSFPMSIVAKVPLIGSPARAISDTSGAGLHVVAAGRLLADAAERFPTSGKTGVDGHDLTVMHDAAAASAAPIAAAEQQLALAHDALAGPRSAMLPFVSGAVRPVDKVVGDTRKQLVSAGKGLSLLADLTSKDTDARILLLSQDTLELRPTGGFIGSYGVIHFDHGTVSLEEYHSYEDLPAADPPMTPPDDLAPYLYEGGQWDLSNVNWWPNFPYSAATAREMYKRQAGDEVDGVIAVTENLTSRLVGVLGPIHVPGYSQPVVEQGFEDRVVYEVELKDPPDNPRKKFLELLSDQLFDKLFHLDSGHLPSVADAVGRAGAAGDVQVWFADPKRQAAVAGTSFEGALPTPKGDFLMLVDSNMSASKANRNLVKNITYKVTPEANGRMRARLEAVYENQGPQTSINKLYAAYLRVYAPLGAKLLTAQSDTLYDEGQAPDGPYQVFGMEADVQPKGEHVFSIEYELPPTVATGSQYHLTWIRQAGTPADTLSVAIGRKGVNADPGERDFEITQRVGPSRVRAWLHDRWILRKIGF